MTDESIARRNTLKIRTASAVALAAGLALSATGCSLIAPVATQKPYAPSDGVDVTVDGADVRNLMLIADESAENFNVVFSGVNTGPGDIPLTINFIDATDATASAEFLLGPGSTLFGEPEGEEPPQLVPLSDVAPGDTVTAFFQVPGADEVEYEVPVLDGTLAEYEAYVIDPEQQAGAAGAEESDAEGSGADGSGAEGSDQQDDAAEEQTGDE